MTYQGIFTQLSLDKLLEQYPGAVVKAITVGSIADQAQSCYDVADWTMCIRSAGEWTGIWISLYRLSDSKSNDKSDKKPNNTSNNKPNNTSDKPNLQLDEDTNDFNGEDSNDNYIDDEYYMDNSDKKNGKKQKCYKCRENGHFANDCKKV